MTNDWILVIGADVVAVLVALAAVYVRRSYDRQTPRVPRTPS